MKQKGILSCQDRELDKWRPSASEGLQTPATRDVYSVATPELAKTDGPALPMQCVWTRKRPGQSGVRRYSCSAVNCGNSLPADPCQQAFTSQVDMATPLVALRLAAWPGRATSSLGAKGASLYAPFTC